MPETPIPPTAYHTALTLLAHAMLLPAAEQVPYVNRAMALAFPTNDDPTGLTDWRKMRSKTHDAVRKCITIAQQLTEYFETFELQNPAALKQLDLFPTMARKENTDA